MPAVRFVLTRDAEEFAKRTEGLLSAGLECNVLATVLMTVLDGAHRDPPPIFAIGITEHDEVSFASMRTPPWPLLTSPLEPGHAEALVDRWLQHDPDLPGVSGVPKTAQAIAAAWERRTGGTSRRTFSEAMHVLTEVQDPPRPAPGALRLPRSDERDLLVVWTEEFIGETGLVGAAQAEQMVDARLGKQGLLVWDDGGPVSLVGVNPAVAGVVRIGPVYTPRPFRGRGYAGSAVAAVSRRALAGGADRCMLFTDLANPTSNKIYAEVGYRRCGDWEEIALDRA
ncbi:MAG TPA: GNAT family N-acetyltransferase [Solirubrobacteraceae bacterium]|nr:GNAT family N-acetyltransferase [Solirubrobacteraceae bacterium]